MYPKTADASPALPATKGRLCPLDRIERALILSAVGIGSSEGEQWAEKLRRFASLYGRNLKKEAERRFVGESVEHLRWIGDVLDAAMRVGRQRGRNPVDPAMLSAALYVNDALRVKGSARNLQDAVAELRNWLITSEVQPPLMPALGEEFAYRPGLWASEAAQCRPVALLCPTNYSLYSMIVAQVLSDLGVDVKAIIARKASLSRIKAEVARDGWQRILRKIWRKMILRSDENPDQSAASLRHLYDSVAPERPALRSFGAHKRIPVIEVANFDDALQALGALRPDIGVFTGGGLVSQAVLDEFATGVINVHMGHLPQYIGMDVVQAPVIEGRNSSVGATAHFMEKNLDRGPVITKFSLNSDSYPSLGSLRNELSAMLPLLAIEATLGVSSGRIVPIPQPEGGRQFYFLHPSLKIVLDECMAARFRPQEVGAVSSTIAQFERDYQAWRMRMPVLTRNH